MLFLQETIASELVQRSVEIASKAFGTDFLHVPSREAGRKSSFDPDQQDSTVEFELSRRGEETFIEFTISLDSSRKFQLRGSVAAPLQAWLEPLACTVQDLILKEIELLEQDHLLTDYASQISRDFEELVWTREFAKRIQQTDIRNSLGEFVEQICPTLMETVQSTQLVLVQYLHPIPKTADIPNLQHSKVHKLGIECVDVDTVKGLIPRYSSRARQQSVVCNHCSTLGIAQLEAFILVPMHSKEQEFGWIIAINHKENTSLFETQSLDSIGNELHLEFSSFEAGLMQSTASFLASHANNISLYSDKEGLLISIVNSLVSAIDAKDCYTYGHSSRVASISKKLAVELGLNDEECEEVYLAGLLHDIGKIGVPDRVLSKRSALTEDESELLRQHPVIGGQVLKDLKQFSYILAGIQHHHESLDGSGYPDGLVGDQIPLPARIIAVADAYDAMISDRPYRTGMPVEKAEQILFENLGPQWDPSVLQAFFNSKDEIHSLWERSIADQLPIDKEDALVEVAN